MYIYLCCADRALTASNVPIFKVLQHYFLTEHGEFKAHYPLIWAYPANIRSIFCVPKHGRCYRIIITQEVCIYSEFRLHFSNMMYFIQVLTVPTPANVQASHSLKMLPDTWRNSSWNTSNQFTFEESFSSCKECRFPFDLQLQVCPTNNNQTDSTVGSQEATIYKLSIISWSLENVLCEP